MAKEVYCFNEESGNVAYLVGVVDTLTECYLVPHCPKYSNIEADLIHVGENKELDFSKAIKERFKKYVSMVTGEQDLYISEIADCSIGFEKRQVQGTIQLPDVLLRLFESMTGFVDNDEIRESFKEYDRAVYYYLGEPLAEYRVISDYKLFQYFYMGIVHQIVCIEYDEYLLLLISGTTE